MTVMRARIHPQAVLFGRWEVWGVGVRGSSAYNIASFRDVQWRQIWCIVGLKVDQNKTTAVRVTVKRIFQ